MEEVKTFVCGDDTATFICPSCKKTRKVSAAPFRGKKNAIKVRCGCGTAFILKLNFRHHYRKETNLSGTYTIATPGEVGGGPIIIHNISWEGIGFTCTAPHHLERLMTVHLDFTLDDKKKTRLKKEATIRLIEKNYIGCQFVDTAAEEKALGFYLRP